MWTRLLSGLKDSSWRLRHCHANKKYRGWLSGVQLRNVPKIIPGHRNDDIDDDGSEEVSFSILSFQ